jgi:hypothetical protein
MANILDLDPFAFAAALEELQLSKEDAARLREQYRQKQSPFAGAKEALKPEEGRNTSDILPVSVPEGMSIAEGVTSGNWDWAIPEGLSGGATAALEGIEAPGQIASGVPFSGQELQDAAWKTAGTAAAGSLTAPVPDGSTRMFGGMRAKKFPWDRYDQYGWQKYDAELKGKKFDEDLAWEDFGVEDTPEGVVFQIDPAGATVKAPAQVDKKLDSIIRVTGRASFDMGEVFDFPELFENYPVLKQFRVSVRDRDQSGKPLKRGGWFDATNYEIVIGVDTAKNPEEFREVMLHELQHGIQAAENTTGGAAVQHFFRQDPSSGDWIAGVSDMEGPIKKLNLSKDRAIDAEVNYGRESETFKEYWDEYVNEYRNVFRLAVNKYMTNPGEVQARAAQLWDQLSSEEKRTTRPSSVGKQALGLLKQEYGDTYMPTAKLSNNYATGGMVQGTNMEQDMTKLFAEGGVNTGEVEVDPVSGNEVPPGSLPEEVRDDVDAKLSGGEYVVPADVLRYYGVSFFEKLRKKAKEGLAEMDAEGRIGGDTAPAEGMTEGPEMDEEDDDLPFEDNDLMYEEDDMEFAQGGAVPGQNAFNPNQFYSGFSAFGDVPQAETRTYVSASGQRMSIQFVNGQPQQPIPAGFYPEGQLPTNPTAAPSQPQETGRRDAERNQSQTRQNTNEGFDWAKGKDFKNMSATEASALANSRLEGNNMAQGIAQGVGALLGPAGALMSGAMKMRPVAEVNGIERHLRSIGNTEAANAVAAIGDKYISERGIGLRALENVIAPGTQVAKTLAAMQGQAAPQAAAKAGSSAAGRTIVKDGDRSGGAGPAKGPISGPKGGSSQKKGSTAPAPRPAPAKETPRASAPSKPGKASTTARAEGGLIQRRKK